MIHYLVYLSTATSLYSDETLASILETSRRNNSKKQITGMLLYHDGAIIQVLEGDKTALNHLFRLLELDPRHHGLIKVMEGDSDKRFFEEWAMGFRRLSDKQWTDMEGYLPIDKTFLSSSDQDNESDRKDMLTFLRSFYRANFKMN